MRFRETLIPTLREQNFEDIRKYPIDERGESLVTLNSCPERIIRIRLI